MPQTPPRGNPVAPVSPPATASPPVITSPSTTPPPPIQSAPATAGPTPSGTPPARASFYRVLAAVVSLVGGLLGIATVSFLITPEEKLAAFISVVVVALLIFQTSSMRRAVGWFHLLSTLFIFLAAIASTGYLGYSIPHNEDAHIADNLAITYPRDGQGVGRCVDVVGSGSIPDGYTLWTMLVLYPGGKPEYWFGAQAVPDNGSITSPKSSTGWTASGVSIGANDKKSIHAGLQAVLIPTEWSDYLNVISADNADSIGVKSHIWSNFFPPGSKAGKIISVTRNQGNSGCS